MVKQAEMLFIDFPAMREITRVEKEKNTARVFTGGVRINNGMYRTDAEERKHREKSLRRKLP